MSKILLIEPPGDFIRLDRCMQSIDSWGGVYRFPLNLARIGAHLMSLGHKVRFADLQAEASAHLNTELLSFKPDLCILSSGFPSMRVDNELAREIKLVLPQAVTSTFGAVPTLMHEGFFSIENWGFDIHFDFAVTGGDPAQGYEKVLGSGLEAAFGLVEGGMHHHKSIETFRARPLFNHTLYRSPFTGEKATYIEGTYGCPFRCSFCVVPALYGGRWSRRSPADIVEEFKYVIEHNGVSQVTLWDEGTTFQQSFLRELCDGLIELRKSRLPGFRDFIWTTRSTTTLLDEEAVEKLAMSGLAGITLGLESFNANILGAIEKNVTCETHDRALRLLSQYGIISIGHLILGHLEDTHESIKETITGALASRLDFAQFYCAVPYPGTRMGTLASEHGLVRVKDLTKYELCNPIMDTLGGVGYREVGAYRHSAIERFWSPSRWRQLDQSIGRGHGIDQYARQRFLQWKQGPVSPIAPLAV